ncbi:cornifelin homolog A-like isoform X2 [Gambusia affinis]|uniref:cornifelin homolog A-like isoform X2 n=1 Tax=Gambusia affinis TaxID=33528 RepID=UPI001CDCC1AA|nr:cornifelin homolog A-like isoform X2 [Gambusia affinis]
MQELDHELRATENRPGCFGEEEQGKTSHLMCKTFWTTGAEDMSADVQATQPRAFTMTSASKQWSSGICDCCQDSALCCYTCWCFPCFACQTAKEAGECLCLPLLDAFGLIPPMATSLRASIRHRYGIEGSVCSDCVYASFCGPCTWCQISREIKTRQNPVVFVSAAA